MIFVLSLRPHTAGEQRTGSLEEKRGVANAEIREFESHPVHHFRKRSH